MLFSKPISFVEAQRSRKVKALLPNALTSRQIQALAPQLRERASFSALVERVEFLQKWDDISERIINGELDLASGRLEAKQFLRDEGFQPDPEKRGTIQDITTTARQNVKLKTDVEVAQGRGFWEQGQDAALLDEYPGWELFRLEERKVKRNWSVIWKGLGGQLFDGGRMIALKNDEIWAALGDGEDGLGNPYPPFRFGTGMWTRNVSRDECLAFGVLQPGQKQEPKKNDFNDLLQASPNIRSQALRDTILAELGDNFQFDGNVLKKK